MKHNYITKSGLTLLSSLMVCLASPQLANAAPGTLTSSPLYVSAYAKPNIMFMIDNSGSMSNVVPDAPYDPATDYTPANCGGAGAGDPLLTFTTGTVELRITGSTPNARVNNTNYAIGTICFDRTRDYYAKLNANGGGGAVSGYARGSYKGNYLNWYFSTIDNSATWTTQTMKPAPGVDSRINIAKIATKSLIDSLSGVRFGLSSFNGSAGGTINVGVADVDAALKTTLKTAVDGFSPSGSTPLSETLLDIGRYFVGENSPQYDGNLTLFPGSASPVTEDDDDVFGHSPNYATGVSDASPIQYSCQKSFAVLLTDGRPQSDRSLLDDSWTVSEVLDYDGDCTGASPACDSYDRKPAGSTGANGGTYGYESSGSDYVDDVAAMLYDIDLRPDLTASDGTPVKNNLVTYTIGFADDQVINDPLMYDTGINGGGDFLTASNGAALKAIFESATASILAQTSTAAAVTFNSSNLSNNTAVYQALFNTGRWSGDLRSFPLNGFTGAVQSGCTLGSNNCWSAATQLDAQSAASRTILEYDFVNNLGAAFTAPADETDFLSWPQVVQDDFCAGAGIPNACNATTWADATMAAENITYITNVINYLRGDRSQEAIGSSPQLRQRAHVLGDLVNASPVFVGRPGLNYPDEAPFPEPPTTISLQGDPATDPSYPVWKNSTTMRNRKGIVYVAANDGLMHGFSTTESSSGAGDAGYEAFAYLPSMMYSSANNAGLHYLANPNYDHRYYNDLTPTVSDVYIKHRDNAGSLTATPVWRTVLLGGLRGGGKGLYLLDITDPTAFSEANAARLVEWEFTHNDLGYTYSKPTIAMMNNGRFAAIFGNGYNEDPNGDGKAKLFIVYLDGGQDGTWTDGSASSPLDYQVITTDAGSMTNNSCADAGSDCNGLATPAVVDLDGNGTADRVYAGDLKGNLWAFDLCNWDSTNLVCQGTGWGVGYTSGSTPVPIMTAQNDASQAQPITVKPIVSINPERSGSDLIIAFGTGQYLTSNDPATTQTQTFYGVFEDDAIINGGDSGLDPRRNQDKFVEQDIGTASCGTGCTARTMSSNNITNNDNGWYIDLDNSSAATGERVITDAKIRNNVLFFNTLIPNTSVCEYGGTSWLMSVDVATGGFPSRPIFDANNDGVIDQSDTDNGDAFVGKQINAIATSPEFLGRNRYVGTSSGTIERDEVDIGSTVKEGRMSWREILAD